MHFSNFNNNNNSIFSARLNVIIMFCIHHLKFKGLNLKFSYLLVNKINFNKQKEANI